MTETEARAMAREWIESRVKASQDSEWKEALFSREALAALILSVDAKAREGSCGNHSHRCICCKHDYTPKPGNAEDCPMCGCDGTEEHAAAIRAGAST